MPAAFCSFRNRNLFSSLILGLGIEVIGKRKSQNTIKSFCISPLLTFVSFLTQLRLKTIGGGDSLVRGRVCFLFSHEEKDEGKREESHVS